jgi:signal transduction histidine kinase
MDRVKPSAQLSGFVVAALCVAVALCGMVVWWGGPRGGGDWTWTLAVALLYGPAGAVMMGHAPRLGSVFLMMAAGSAAALLSGEQAEAVATGRSEYAGALAVWLSSWTWVLPYVLLVAVVPHLLPDGRLLPGRWRWGYRLGLAAAGISTGAWLLAPYDELDEASSAALALGATNPVGIRGASLLIAFGLALTVGLALVGLVSLGVRWRRGHERKRLTWVLLGVAGTVLLLASSLAVPGGSPALLAAAVVPLPAAVVVGAATRAVHLDDQLRLSEARLAVAHEEERRRLRHDLHDSLGPTLAGVALQLEALSTDIEEDPAKAASVASLLSLRVRDAVDEVRRLVDGLGPDGALGLAEALRNEIESFDAPALRSTLDLPDPDRLRDLPAAVELVAVRVVREALTNAARHAAGDRCLVSVSTDDQRLLVTVRDNGVGVTASRASGRRGGVGLLSMQAVAHHVGGSCTVADAVGGGTEVRLTLPLVLA